MPDISITQTPSGPVSPDTPVTLAVAVSPDPSQYTYSWQKADGSTTAGRTIVVRASAGTRGKYRVTATPKRVGGEALTAEHTLQLVGQPMSPGPPDSDRPLASESWFAGGAAIAIFVFAVLLLAPLAYRLYDTEAPDAVDRTATLTSMALLIIGAVVLLLGVYGAVLAVRGRFMNRRDGTDVLPAGTSATVGNNNGAAIADGTGGLGGMVILFLVIGCVPLVAAAWVAQSGVESDGTVVAPTATTRAATRTPSPAPAAPTAPAATTAPTP